MILSVSVIVLTMKMLLLFAMDIVSIRLYFICDTVEIVFLPRRLFFYHEKICVFLFYRAFFGEKNNFDCNLF